MRLLFQLSGKRSSLFRKTVPIVLFLVLFGGGIHARTVRVGIYNNRPKVFLENGRIRGFFPELIEYIAQKEQWRIKYILGSWQECLDRLEAGKIDVMVDVAQSPERSRRFVFNKISVFNNWGVLYVGAEKRIRTIADLDGKTIAVMEKSIHYSGEQGIRELLKQLRVKDIRFHVVKSYRKVFEAVASGKADAGVVNRIFGNIHRQLYRVYKTSIAFNPVDLKFAFSAGGRKNRILIRAIDRHLIQLKQDYTSPYYSLLSKYFLETSFLVSPQKPDIRRFRRKLTGAEKAWIKKHPVIRVGIDPEFVPYEFLDRHKRVQGISSDYIKILNRRLGLNMRIMEKQSWSAAVKKARHKELDVLPCIGKTAQRRDFLLFSRPYISFYRGILARDDSGYIFSVNDIVGRKVAVQRFSSHHGYIVEKTIIQPQLHNSFQDCINAVVRGDAYAAVGNVTVATYWLRRLGLTQLRIAAPVSSEIYSLHFGIRKDWPLLCSIIDKGLQTITRAERDAIRQKWIDVEIGPVHNWWKYIALAGVVLGGLLIIVSVFVLWNRLMAREIQRRKIAEKALKKSEKQKVKVIRELDRQNRKKNEYIGIVAHDLRNPICGIGMMAEYLQENSGEPLSDTQRECMSRIIDMSGYMESLIDNVLDFSLIESGRIELKLEKYDYGQLIHESIRISALIAGRKEIAIKTDIAQHIPKVPCDKKKIDQVMGNLLGNAVKYSHPGTEILVKVSVDDASKKVVTIVRDSGQGIPEDQLDRIFEPFQKAGVQSTAGEKSTGLGLAIVKRIIEAHGGSIGVRSVVGKGSDFRFLLPLKKVVSD